MPQPRWATVCRAGLTRAHTDPRLQAAVPKDASSVPLLPLPKGRGLFALWDLISTWWVPSSTVSSEPGDCCGGQSWPSSGGALAQLSGAKGPVKAGSLPLAAAPWTREARGLVPAEDPVGCPVHRLYPVGISVDRQVSSDVVLQNYHIPAGVSEAPQPFQQTPSPVDLLPQAS